MNIRGLLAAAILAFSGFVATDSEASTYPTFVTDIGSSSITVTQGSGCRFLSCADLVGEFGAGAEDFAWTPTGTSDSVYVDNFFNWSVSGIGAEIFDVVVTLAFSQPNIASTTGTGGGFFLTLGGYVSAGVLVWDGIQSVTFGDGSILDVAYESVIVAGFGNSTSTGATFEVNLSNQIASVPLPPTVPLLVVGLLSLGLLRRRRQANA